MRKNLTHFFTFLMLFIGIFSTTAQTVTVWPTADAATIAASQFADSAQIFKGTTANPNPPAGFKGWVSKPTYSGVVSKAANAHWDWAREGKGSKGAYWGTGLPIGSSTAANGAAIFNSDFLDNGGVAGNFEGGPSPGPHGGELWSPIIDATGKDGLMLIFNQRYRNLDSEFTAVSWSEDGGVTWKDTISIVENDVILVNQLYDGQVGVKLRFPDEYNADGSFSKRGLPSKGTANFRVKFIFDAYYYYWIVDDVKLVSMDFNLRVNRNWYARPQSYAMPRAQVDSVVFMADVENLGNKAATNVKLTATMRDTFNTVIYTATKTYGTIKPDSVAENQVFGKWLPPATGRGTTPYVGTYVISSDNPDNFAPNDTIFYSFFVTDSVYQNDAGSSLVSFGTRPGDGAWQGGTTHSWKAGNYFYFPKGSKSTATRIQALVDTSTLVDVFLQARLYEWKDANNDGAVQVTERTEVGVNEIKVPKVASPATLNFQLENAQGTGVIKLKDNTAYIAMVEFVTTKPNVDMFVRWSKQFPQGPMQQATRLAGRPRYTAVVSRNGLDATPWDTQTFGSDPLEAYTPLVRMWTWPIPTDTKELLSENNKIDLFPNPTSSRLNVSFDLEKTEQAVLVRIIDMSGKILKERDFDNIKKETVSMDVQDIPNGVYNIQIQTIGNYRTMRFVKAE
jgi:Secretion system C-terminal sorting domain